MWSVAGAHVDRAVSGASQAGHAGGPQAEAVGLQALGTGPGDGAVTDGASWAVSVSLTGGRPRSCWASMTTPGSWSPPTSSHARARRGAERTSRGRAGRRARARPRAARSETIAYRSSGRDQNPIGASATAERATRRRISSSARAPPSELPATAGCSTPISSRKWTSRSVSSGTPRGTSCVGRGEMPCPGKGAPTDRDRTHRGRGPLRRVAGG
jgi:hypothetical protein